jgi:hypothetical protein
MRRSDRARQLLASRGIRTPRDLALWARSRGLLSVYIEYLPARGVLPACWQVVRPGHHTDADAPGWQRGNKTFIVRSLRDKHVFEDVATGWAGARFGETGWVRIEGLGNALLPAAVAESLVHQLPELVIYRKRQHRKVG